MLIFALALNLAHAQSSIPCLNAAKSANACCQSPLEHPECLDDHMKQLNKQISMAQVDAHARATGLRDAGREARQRTLALKLSAELKEKMAAGCETKAAECVKVCTPLQTTDGKGAVARCETSAKLVAPMRMEAARDAELARRGVGR